VVHLIEQGDTVGLGSKPHRSRSDERRILHLKQIFAVERHTVAVSLEINPQAMPDIGRHRDRNSIAASAADDIERAAATIDGL
jgi:hypothetical protein